MGKSGQFVVKGAPGRAAAMASVVAPLLTIEFTVVLTTSSTPRTWSNTRESTSPVRVWVPAAIDRDGRNSEPIRLSGTR